MRIKILNWEKYAPRTDRTNHVWFRMNNDFLYDKRLFKLNPLEKLSFVYLLCFCSKDFSQEIELDLDYLEHYSGVKKPVLLSAIKKLEESQMVELPRPEAANPRPDDALQTDIQTLQTDTTNTTGQTPETNITDTTPPPDGVGRPPVSEELMVLWEKTYGDLNWVQFEIKKAESWLAANPKKSPKSDFARFFNNWLSKGWEDHRKTLAPVKKENPLKFVTPDFGWKDKDRSSKDLPQNVRDLLAKAKSGISLGSN